MRIHMDRNPLLLRRRKIPQVLLTLPPSLTTPFCSQSTRCTLPPNHRHPSTRPIRYVVPHERWVHHRHVVHPSRPRSRRSPSHTITQQCHPFLRSVLPIPPSHPSFLPSFLTRVGFRLPPMDNPPNLPRTPHQDIHQTQPLHHHLPHFPNPARPPISPGRSGTLPT